MQQDWSKVLLSCSIWLYWPAFESPAYVTAPQSPVSTSNASKVSSPTHALRDRAPSSENTRALRQTDYCNVECTLQKTALKCGPSLLTRAKFPGNIWWNYHRLFGKKLTPTAVKIANLCADMAPVVIFADQPIHVIRVWILPAAVLAIALPSIVWRAQVALQWRHCKQSAYNDINFLRDFRVWAGVQWTFNHHVKRLTYRCQMTPTRANTVNRSWAWCLSDMNT